MNKKCTYISLLGVLFTSVSFATFDANAAEAESCTAKAANNNNMDVCIKYSGNSTESKCQTTSPPNGGMQYAHRDQGTPPNKDRLCRDINNIANPNCTRIKVTDSSGKTWCLKCKDADPSTSTSTSANEKDCDPPSGGGGGSMFYDEISIRSNRNSFDLTTILK